MSKTTKMDIAGLTDKLLKVGYVARRPECIALKELFIPSKNGAKALLLEGAPGCGKTALSQAFAKAMNFTYVYDLMHSWTDDQQLFVGVDVPAAVAGDAENVRQPGVLARAAEESQNGYVVLCLDEIDKVEERTQNLLLDFLQTGRVPIKPGEHLEAELSNLFIFITSNNTKPLNDALMRRLRRVRMTMLPVDIQDKLVINQANVSAAVARTVGKACREVAKLEGNDHLSLQEIINATRSCFECAETASDVQEIVTGYSARTEKAYNAAKNCTPHFQAALAEIKVARK